MPRQNRVTPIGQLIATPARGTLMGNRGVLHDEQGQIRRHHNGKRWILCQLSFKDRHRQVMTPNRYTELFFLDEATALAAGHRPCAECMRPRFNEFRQLWAAANPDLAGEPNPSINVIDNALQQERVRLARPPEKVTYPDQLGNLPTGTFITLPSAEYSYLVYGQTLLLWTPEQYLPASPLPLNQIVQVLTPASIVRTLRSGFVPKVHTSALTFGR